MRLKAMLRVRKPEAGLEGDASSPKAGSRPHPPSGLELKPHDEGRREGTRLGAPRPRWGAARKSADRAGESTNASDTAVLFFDRLEHADADFVLFAFADRPCRSYGPVRTDRAREPSRGDKVTDKAALDHPQGSAKRKRSGLSF